MARLTTPVTLPDLFGTDGFVAHDKAFEALLESDRQVATRGLIAGRLIRFQIADGYAWYRVEATRPLTLAHVPFGDSYALPDAHIRGLSLADVKGLLQRKDALHSLFGGAP